MSTLTNNYKLVKPELTDPADITAMNGNWDIIDEKLSEVNGDYALNDLTNVSDEDLQAAFERINVSDDTAGKAFIAVYGTTTFDEVKTAYEAGQTVLLDYNGTHRLQLTYNGGTTFNFAGFVDAGDTVFNAVCDQTNGWSLLSQTYVKKTGDTMTGQLIANNNNGYTTPQVRNISLHQSLPSSIANGAIVGVYEI